MGARFVGTKQSGRINEVAVMRGCTVFHTFQYIDNGHLRCYTHNFEEMLGERGCDWNGYSKIRNLMGSGTKK